MVVQNNVPALNSHRNLMINNSNLARNLERLSSGFRINRAADDAAGLAISERMRGQIRGLGMAEQNTSHAINLIQTAEGALQETHSIMQRMRELAVQSSNGTFQDSDRMQINHEFQALMSEIDRIAESTHYNGINLLDGSLGSSSMFGGSGVSSAALFNIDRALAGGLDSGVFNAVAGTQSVWTSENVTGSAGADSLDADDAADFVVRDITVNFLDNEGNAQSVTVTIDNVSATGAPADWTDTNVVQTAVLDALRGTELANHFVIDFAGDDLTLTSILNGQEGASRVTSVTFEQVINNVTSLNGTGQNEVRANLHSMANTNRTGNQVQLGDDTAFVAGNNATLAVNLNHATINVGNGNQNWFEIGGQKFVLSNSPEHATGSAVAGGGIYLNAVNFGTMTATEQALIGRAVSEAVGMQVTVTATGFTIEAASTATGGQIQGQELTFQIGANGGADQRVSLSVNAMDTRNLGISSIDVGFEQVTGSTLSQASILTQSQANAAIDIIDGALDMVSAQRAQLGAMQNRLESTMNSLGIARENLTAAESTIRDVDMAAEMMQFTQNNILTQAAQAMLAQANQLPQGVLQLLR